MEDVLDTMIDSIDPDSYDLEDCIKNWTTFQSKMLKRLEEIVKQAKFDEEE